MPKKHGYSSNLPNRVEAAVGTTEESDIRITSPASEASFETEQYLDEPTSGSLFLDLDSDREKKMQTLSPFYGDTLKVFKAVDGVFKSVFEYEKKPLHPCHLP